MRYIDAGYVAALGSLAVYGAVLWQRRRRLERAVRRLQEHRSGR